MVLVHHWLESDHSFMALDGKWTWCENRQSLSKNHRGCFSAGVVLNCLSRPGGGGGGGGGSVRESCRLLLSGGENRSCENEVLLMRGNGSLGAGWRVRGEGSVWHISVGRGSSREPMMGMSRRSSGPEAGAPPPGPAVETSNGLGSCGAAGAVDMVILEAPTAGLVGDGGIFNLPDPELRGGGYVSPRASAAAFRRSVSALLGRPRFLGGSPVADAVVSNRGETCAADAPLSLLYEAALLTGGRG